MKPKIISLVLLGTSPCFMGWFSALSSRPVAGPHFDVFHGNNGQLLGTNGNLQLQPEPYGLWPAHFLNALRISAQNVNGLKSMVLNANLQTVVQTVWTGLQTVLETVRTFWAKVTDRKFVIEGYSWITPFHFLRSVGFAQKVPTVSKTVCSPVYTVCSTVCRFL